MQKSWTYSMLVSLSVVGVSRGQDAGKDDAADSGPRPFVMEGLQSIGLSDALEESRVSV
ncbi:MAG: hypothetical protein HY292_28525 [Planctomycetes bacterium]|nr:hypothetical protein [Planctomycetota bacterium]